MMNTRVMLAAVAPMDFSIPMSRVFSNTTMIRVLAMLNAATRMIRLSMANEPHFSSVIPPEQALVPLHPVNRKIRYGRG